MEVLLAGRGRGSACLEQRRPDEGSLRKCCLTGMDACLGPSETFECLRSGLRDPQAVLRALGREEEGWGVMAGGGDCAKKGERRGEKGVRKSHGEKSKNVGKRCCFSYQVISKMRRAVRDTGERGVLNFAGCEIVRAKMK